MSSETQSKFILIIGPSGVGKGTLLQMLKERKKEIFFPVSATTRDPRPREKEGETYYFLSKESFELKIAAGEFLEYACVHGKNYYGMLKAPILKALEEGKIVVRECDYQGFLLAREVIPVEQLKSVFILPPEESILRKRIQERAPISNEELDARMESLRKEVEVAKECDVQLQTINVDIEASYQVFEKEILV